MLLMPNLMLDLRAVQVKNVFYGIANDVRDAQWKAYKKKMAKQATKTVDKKEAVEEVAEEKLNKETVDTVVETTQEATVNATTAPVNPVAANNATATNGTVNATTTNPTLEATKTITEASKAETVNPSSEDKKSFAFEVAPEEAAIPDPSLEVVYADGIDKNGNIIPNVKYIYLSEDSVRDLIDKVLLRINPDNDIVKDKQIRTAIPATLWMTAGIKPDNIFNLVGVDRSAWIFVNAIAESMTGIKIYSDAETANIEDVINLQLFRQILEATKDELENFVKLHDLDNLLVTNYDKLFMFYREAVSAADARQKERAGLDANNPIVPVLFVNSNLVLTDPAELDKALDIHTVTVLENIFGEMIGNVPHQFNNLHGLIELAINDPVTGFRSYKIDPNLFIGNGYNVLCNVPGNDWAPVNAARKDILTKALANHEYVLTPEEYRTILGDMFPNIDIYRMVDMHDTLPFMAKLSGEEFVKLSKKLSFIININYAELNIPYTRVRFSRFNSVDDFVLRSDQYCVSPFVDSGITYPIAAPGLEIVVNGDIVNVVVNNQIVKSCEIKEYNML